MFERLSTNSNAIRVVVAERHPLFYEGMSAILRSSTSPLFEPIVVDCDHLESDWHDLNLPHLLWYRMASETAFVEDLVRLRQAFPTAPLVVIDETPNDWRLLTAVGGEIRGYQLTSQTSDEILAQLERVANGERAFAPAIASRLRITPSGIELKANNDVPALASLSPREREVMHCLARGHTGRQCASILGLSPSTIENHRTRMMRKLDVHKTTELIRLAIKHGLVDNEA